MQAIERNWGTKSPRGNLKGPYTAQQQGDNLIQIIKKITIIPCPYLTHILSSEKNISLVYKLEMLSGV